MNFPDQNSVRVDEPDLMPLYATAIQQLDALHWSPLPIVQLATRYLAGGNSTRILDIGSGVGKFCIAGAYLQPQIQFYGVEQRKYLVNEAERIKCLLEIKNVHFLHGNFTQMHLEAFQGFYFYNSFFENLPSSEKIDDAIDYSADLYDYYNSCLRSLLALLPGGTRVATYCSWDDEIPPGYLLTECHSDDLLKFWIKV